MCRRDPVNGAFDLASVWSPPAPCGRVIRTAQFHHLASAFVLHDPRAGDIVGVAQPYLAARGQTEELPGWVFTKIIAFNVEHARERHLACAHTLVLGIIDRLQLLHLAFRIVLDDHAQGAQDSHHTLSPLVEIFAQTVFEQGDVDHTVPFRYANALAECPDGLRRVAAPAQP